MVESTAPAAPSRRLPFKPTALRKPSAPSKAERKHSEEGEDDEDDDGLSLFNRSKDFFPKTIAEQEARRKSKQSSRENSLRRSQSKSEATKADSGVDEDNDEPILSQKPRSRSDRKRPSWTADVDDPRGPISTPPSKRSRTSVDSTERKPVFDPSPSRDVAGTPSKRFTRSLAVRTPQKESSLIKSPAPASQRVILIDDSDEEGKPNEPSGNGDSDSDIDINNASPLRKHTGKPKTDPHSEAEARSDLHLQIQDDDPFKEDDEEQKTASDAVPDEFADYVRAARERQRKAEEAKKDQLEVLLLATSDLPDAKAIQFKFTLWKPMRVVRDAWCKTRGVELGLSREELDGVFITWRGHRVYDSTTLNSLGIGPSVGGKLRHASGSGSDAHETEGFAAGWRQVHVQVWTEALWDEHQRRRERARLRELGELDDASEGDEDDSAAMEGDARAQGRQKDEEPEGERKIKVILKTRSDQPVKTTVRPATTVETLITYFRQQRNVAEETQVVLYFDGEQLEEGTTVEDAEIEDMDTIEVHVKE